LAIPRHHRDSISVDLAEKRALTEPQGANEKDRIRMDGHRNSGFTDLPIKNGDFP
jgi:hypothetical protein